MSKRGRLAFLGFAALAAAGIGPALAQTVQDTAKRLTGPSSRDWVSVQFRTVMGTGSCTQGEVYRFAANGTLTIEQCRNGGMESTRHSWQLRQPSALDTELLFDAHVYRILFRTENGADMMLLRVTPESKLKPFEERIFKLSRD